MTCNFQYLEASSEEVWLASQHHGVGCSLESYPSPVVEWFYESPVSPEIQIFEWSVGVEMIEGHEELVLFVGKPRARRESNRVSDVRTLKHRVVTALLRLNHGKSVALDS